jgi:glycosyl transferase family 4/O-antigen ligase/polysaccharide polymerase Wzy-like membrane protein
VTVVWTVGLINAFNLMDNMDGAAATIGAVTALAIGVLSLIEGDVALATLVFGLAGACLGFLPYNLSAPARIFLGDGGSLPIGFVLAAAIMALPADHDTGLARLLAAGLLAGLPVLDTALVFVSRWRAGVPLLSGGRDHLTHRLATRLGSPRTVAFTLGLIQALIAAVAIAVTQGGEGSVVTAWSIWFAVGAGSVALLETRTWAPERTWGAPSRGQEGSVSRGPGRSPSFVEWALIAFIALACGLSPFLYGFYDLGVWGPIALVLLAALVGLLIARPAMPRPSALVAGGALGLVWVWAFLSTSWAESADQAMVDANRWLLYATLFALLVLLLRDDRLGALVIGAGTAAIGVLAGYIVVRMVGGTGADLFLSGRLNKPLGYVNGQAGYLLLGVWPLIALAERARRPWLAGAGLAGATLLGGLAILGQTRALVPALVISALVLLAAVPGRLRRAWCVVFVVAGVAAALPWLLDVYDAALSGRPPSDDVLRKAALAIVVSSALVGAAWGVASWLAGRAAPGARRVSAGVLIAGACLVPVVVLSSVHDPVGRVKRQYNAFVQLRTQPDASSRFVSGGGNRYDYWRVAVNEFQSSPFRGVGAGNYDRDYFLERRTTEDIRNPHSIWLQALGELGLVGGLLVLVFVAAVLAGFARRVSAAQRDRGQAALAVAAGGTFLVWLLHTSVDWLHLIPGLTGIALGAAAVLVGPWRPGAPSGHPRRRTAITAAAAVVAVVGAIAVGRVTLADHYRHQGQEAVNAGNSAQAIEHARDSLSLNDETLSTYYVLAAAEARLGRYRQARTALAEATRREPHDFVPWGLLGDLAVRRGDLATARQDYGTASRLNPRDPSLRTLARNPRAALSGF